MKKKILIIGGGISGLSVLHHLRTKYAARPEVEINLVEMSADPGGNIRTLCQNGFQFETGPSGFVDSNPSTLELAEEIGLAPELITANPESKTRYICVENNLYGLKSPFSLFSFPFLSWQDKVGLFKEWSRTKGTDPNETVYDFASRRLGPGFAKYFISPLVTGIYGGNAKALITRYAFPLFYKFEQEYGSVMKGAFQSPKEPKQRRGRQMWSFKKGLSALTDALAAKHQQAIQCRTTVSGLKKAENGSGYEIRTADHQTLSADQLILSVPAYAAADMLSGFDLGLARNLKSIFYSPVVMLGLGYAQEQISEATPGFGYLRLPDQGQGVLGVIFSSQIYAHRAPAGQKLFQMVVGGALQPDLVRYNDDDLLALAQNEMEKVLRIKGKPSQYFIARHGRAIPQYDQAYAAVIESIKEKVACQKGLYLLSNYLGGVAVNDCTTNAKKLAEQITI